MKKVIAIMALQGAFAEHQKMLERLEVETLLIRNKEDWDNFIVLSNRDDYKGLGLIIPGGESTTMTRIMHDEMLWEPIRKAIKEGLPVFGTCAGMIMLDKAHLDVMDIDVKRNAYGRQLGSFFVEYDMKHIGKVPMTFIRAPYINSMGDGVEAFAVLDGHCIAARQNNMLVTSFHPELNDDLRIHEYFVNSVC